MTTKDNIEAVIPLVSEEELEKLSIELAKNISIETEQKYIYSYGELLEKCIKLDNILNELENYLKSHTRKAIEELQFENINKNTFYAFKKIALLDRNKIYDILQKRK